jgi:hypothetical protein
LLPGAPIVDTGTRVIYGKTPLDGAARRPVPPKQAAALGLQPPVKATPRQTANALISVACAGRGRQT